MDFRGARKKSVSIGEDRKRYIQTRGMIPRIYQEEIRYVELKADRVFKGFNRARILIEDTENIWVRVKGNSWQRGL